MSNSPDSYWLVKKDQSILWIFVTNGEHNQLHKFKQMIDSQNLLKNDFN